MCGFSSYQQYRSTVNGEVKKYEGCIFGSRGISGGKAAEHIQSMDLI
jgi:hypothetical protein